MKITGMLPIGTVVMLKNSTHRVMLTGYLQRKVSGKEKVYDYVAVPFPEGMVGPDKNFLFDNDQIETLYGLGYLDGDTQLFLGKIEAIQAKLRNGELTPEAEEAEEADEDVEDAPEL